MNREKWGKIGEEPFSAICRETQIGILLQLYSGTEGNHLLR